MALTSDDLDALNNAVQTYRSKHLDTYKGYSDIEMVVGILCSAGFFGSMAAKACKERNDLQEAWDRVLPYIPCCSIAHPDGSGACCERHAGHLSAHRAYIFDSADSLEPRLVEWPQANVHDGRADFADQELLAAE